MKIIYNKYIPFPGFIAVNLFGIILARKEYDPLDMETMNHELIHSEQMKEMLYVFFYIWYIVEWGVHFLRTGNSIQAYRDISFEKEAEKHELDPRYISRRKRYSWTKYLNN